MSNDRESLRGFLCDALMVGHADAAAMLAALHRRVAAAEHDWLLAALELLRGLHAALRKASAVIDRPL